MAEDAGAWPMPWGVAKDLGASPRQLGLTLTLTLRPCRVAKAGGDGQNRGGVAMAVVALPRPWVRGQCFGGVAKAVEAIPRPWRRCQGCGGRTKAVGAWQRPWGRGQGRED